MTTKGDVLTSESRRTMSGGSGLPSENKSFFHWRDNVSTATGVQQESLPHPPTSRHPPPNTHLTSPVSNLVLPAHFIPRYLLHPTSLLTLYTFSSSLHLNSSLQATNLPSTLYPHPFIAYNLSLHSTTLHNLQPLLASCTPYPLPSPFPHLIPLSHILLPFPHNPHPVRYTPRPSPPQSSRA